MDGMMPFILAMGIPSAICGLIVWYLKRTIEANERKREEHDRDIKNMMLMIIKTGKANYVLSTATAKAVQRIPDAHCNGDMTSALAEAAAIQEEENAFLVDQGMKRVFE